MTNRFRNWLKEQRAKRGISLEYIAQCLDVSPATVKKWEDTGVSHPYARHGLRYFFEQYDKSLLRGGFVSEIPDNGKPQLATGTWLSWWTETEGVSVAELAERLGVTDSCVYRWKKPETKLPILTEYAIRQAMKDLGK